MDLTKYYQDELGIALAKASGLAERKSFRPRSVSSRHFGFLLTLQKHIGEREDKYELLFQSPYRINVTPHFSMYDNFEHFHDFFEIIYVHMGECASYVDKAPTYLCSGDICLLNLQASHYLITNDPENTVVFSILINRSVLDKARLDLLSQSEFVSDFFLDSLRQKRKKDNFLTFRPSEDGSGYENYVQHIVREWYEGDLYRGQMLESLFTALLIELARSNKRSIDIEALSEPEPRDISEIIQYIFDNHQTISIQALAEHFHYQPSYLSTLIKRHTGSSFSDILHNARFKKALIMLKETSYTVDSIMRAVGYSDRTWFTKKFKERYSLLPSEYRRRFS